MKFRLHYKNQGSDQIHTEDYNKDVPDIQKWGEEIIEYYNSTIVGKFDKPRIFVKCEELFEVKLKKSTTKLEHNFRKMNMFTLTTGKRPFDQYECKCGVTAKRFGLDETMVRDSKWKNKKYEYCTGTRVK